MCKWLWVMRVLRCLPIRAFLLISCDPLNWSVLISLNGLRSCHSHFSQSLLEISHLQSFPVSISGSTSDAPWKWMRTIHNYRRKGEVTLSSCRVGVTVWYWKRDWLSSSLVYCISWFSGCDALSAKHWFTGSVASNRNCIGWKPKFNSLWLFIFVRSECSMVYWLRWSQTLTLPPHPHSTPRKSTEVFAF